MCFVFLFGRKVKDHGEQSVGSSLSFLYVNLYISMLPSLNNFRFSSVPIDKRTDWVQIKKTNNHNIQLWRYLMSLQLITEKGWILLNDHFSLYPCISHQIVQLPVHRYSWISDGHPISFLRWNSFNHLILIKLPMKAASKYLLVLCILF